MFEPRIVCFFCKWCTYAGADLAGTSRKQYPPNGVVVRVNCSGRIDPQHVLWAFREGADGVLIGGCHPGDCHYQDGNHKTMRRVVFLKRMLKDMGVDPKRLHLEWISAAEGEKLVHVMSDFVDAMREMGPMNVELAGGGKLRVTPPASPKKASKKPAGKAKPAPKKAKKATRPVKRVATKTATRPKKTAKKKTVTKKVASKVTARTKTTAKKKAAPKKVASKVAAGPKKTAKEKAVAKKTAKRVAAGHKKTTKKAAHKRAARRTR